MRSRFQRGTIKAAAAAAVFFLVPALLTRRWSPWVQLSGAGWDVVLIPLGEVIGLVTRTLTTSCFTVLCQQTCVHPQAPSVHVCTVMCACVYTLCILHKVSVSVCNKKEIAHMQDFLFDHLTT